MNSDQISDTVRRRAPNPDLTPSDYVHDELNAFHHDLLAAVEGDDKSGSEVRERLETYYDTEVHNGRLYPNLDILAYLGLIEKRERKRSALTNEYAITPDGLEVIQLRVGWLAGGSE